jgi:hypothetical protein
MMIRTDVSETIENLENLGIILNPEQEASLKIPNSFRCQQTYIWLEAFFLMMGDQMPNSVWHYCFIIQMK